MFSLLVVVTVIAGASSAVVPELDPVVIDPALHLDNKTTSLHMSRIINGEDAAPGEFPHQLTLLYNSYHICGAALIHPRWAVTAAHCVDGGTASQFSVAGNFINFQSPGSYWIYDIQQIIMHTGYNQGSGAFPNDIALLRLPANTINLNPYVISVAHSSDSATFDNTSCVISGWGNTEAGTTSILKKAEVFALTYSHCASYWGSSNILSQHICVKGYGDSGRGSCNGDSGGPLTCDGRLAGVTSWGRSGCHVGGTVIEPSVYARISYFYTWLRTNCGNCV